MYLGVAQRRPRAARHTLGAQDLLDFPNRETFIAEQLGANDNRLLPIVGFNAQAPRAIGAAYPDPAAHDMAIVRLASETPRGVRASLPAQALDGQRPFRPNADLLYLPLGHKRLEILSVLIEVGVPAFVRGGQPSLVLPSTMRTPSRMAASPANLDTVSATSTPTRCARTSSSAWLSPGRSA